MANNTQNIKCKVFNCEFNNNTFKHCELNEIEVNCDCEKESRLLPYFLIFYLFHLINC